MSRCSCDDIGEGPCTIHAEENDLQNTLLHIKAFMHRDNGQGCPECGAETGCNIDCEFCLFYISLVRLVMVGDALLTSIRRCQGVTNQNTLEVFKTLSKGIAIE